MPMREILRGRFEYDKDRGVWKLWFMYNDDKKKCYDTEHLEFPNMMSMFGYLMVYQERHRQPGGGGGQ